MKDLTIGKLAKEAQVNVETVRYYERRGLIPKPRQPKLGYRQYSQDIVSRIHFIKRAQELGFTLKEISELLYLRVDPSTTCADVKKRTEIKIADIEEKIRALESIRKALRKLVALCRGKGPTGECPIMEVLETRGGKNG